VGVAWCGGGGGGKGGGVVCEPRQCRVHMTFSQRLNALYKMGACAKYVIITQSAN
jgi:hypothetical protein